MGESRLEDGTGFGSSRADLGVRFPLEFPLPLPLLAAGAMGLSSAVGSEVAVAVAGSAWRSLSEELGFGFSSWGALEVAAGVGSVLLAASGALRSGD